MTPIHTGPATGVKVKYIGEIHYWGREAYISARSAFGDAEAEVWTSDTGSGSTNAVEIESGGSREQKLY